VCAATIRSWRVYFGVHQSDAHAHKHTSGANGDKNRALIMVTTRSGVLAQPFARHRPARSPVKARLVAVKGVPVGVLARVSDDDKQPAGAMPTLLLIFLAIGMSIVICQYEVNQGPVAALPPPPRWKWSPLGTLLSLAEWLLEEN
jgi:hypothetical protein